MEPCPLNYIPERLHTNDRGTIQNFVVDELLFFRCAPEKLSNPYNDISLVELSHNRRGTEEENLISEKDDVLYNIKPENNFEIYLDKVVSTIRIKDLNPDNQYYKTLTDNKNNTARIILLHDPAPCMYPHCFFRISYNNEVANYQNKIYKQYNELRNKVKHEFTIMLYKEVLSQAG